MEEGRRPREFVASDPNKLLALKGPVIESRLGRPSLGKSHAQLKIVANRRRCSFSRSKARRTAAKDSASGKMSRLMSKSLSSAPAATWLFRKEKPPAQGHAGGFHSRPRPAAYGQKLRCTRTMPLHTP